MSNNRSLLLEINGKPVCWHWNISNIIQYIQDNQEQAYYRYTSEDPTDTTRPESFTGILNRVLLRCLRDITVYSYTDDSQEQVETCLVSFHLRKHEVPIADVYSALGWFISYSEDPSVVSSDDCPLFVLYTRLCHNIAAEVNEETRRRGINLHIRISTYDPAKTHLFWVGSQPVLTVHPSESEGERGPTTGRMNVQMTFSASLPRANAPYDVQSNPKNILKAARERMISHITGPLVMDKMKELNGAYVGNCAETLNYASFANRDSTTATVGFGLSLTTNRVGGSFTSYAEILRQAHSPPCESCRELFIHGGVTQQDFGSGRILGNLPDGTVVQPSWADRNNTPMCSHCHSPITDRMNMTGYCSSRCRIQFIEYRERTQYGYPPTRNITSWTAPNVPGPSTSNQSYIPATAGYPPSAPHDYTPVTAQWSFHAPPDVNPLPSWRSAHPDRVPGHRDYQPPY